MKANIENFKELLLKSEGDKDKMEKAFTRISEYLASSILGRDFAEDVEHYLNRGKQIKEIHEWAKKVVISPRYTIISI